MFNVRDFGAIGDGSVDDRLAIQAAIDAAALGGGTVTVFIPAGTYIIGTVSNPDNQPLIVPSNIRLIGEGVGHTILRLPDHASQYAPWGSQVADPMYAASLAMLLINSGNPWWFGTGGSPDFPLPEPTSNIEIASMTLDANNISQPVIYNKAIPTSNARGAILSGSCAFAQLSNAYLHDLELCNSADSGLLLVGTSTTKGGVTNSRFERVWIHHSGWIALSIIGEASDLSFDNCVMEYNDNQGAAIGISS
jgi:hypothetical protein